MIHPIATRSGQPAYLNAPPRLTQRMVDLDRRLKERSELRELVEEAHAAGEPNLALGVLFACFLTSGALAVVACICAMVPA
jgi:hypothetical protein